MTNNPQAFPCDSRESQDFAGMTLRDYFAGQAILAIVGKHKAVTANCLDRQALQDIREMSLGAYAVADAMLKARAETQ